MKYDINKLLDLDYLYELLSTFNNEFNGISVLSFKLYNLDDFMNMDIEDINSLFGKYNIDNYNLVQYLKNDFIDSDWEFADLYSDDVELSIKQKNELKEKALFEIENLNYAISLDRDEVNKRKNVIENEIINIKNLIRIFDENVIITEEDVMWLYDFLSSHDFTSSERYQFSSLIVKLLIAKNKELSQKEDEENLQEFETTLDDIYSSPESLDISYDEIIIGYYDKYRVLFDEVQLGSTLEDIIDMVTSLGEEIQIITSLDDFCIKFVSLLSQLHNARINGLDDEYKSILTELEKLDEFYNDNKDRSFNLKSDVDDLLSKINYLDVSLDFKDEITYELLEIKKQLSKSFVEATLLDSIFVRYNFINQTVNQLFSLTALNMQISDLIIPTSGYVEHNGDYYTKISEIRSRVLLLIDKVIKEGYNQSIEEIYNDICIEIKNYQNSNTEQTNENVDSQLQLSGFVLFDFGQDNIPYVLEDLNVKGKNSLIDSSIISNKLNSGFSDYSNLIRDLLLYGKPEVLQNGNTMAYADKIMGSVFYDETSKVPTGMVRIRPSKSSIVRFVSKAVVLKPGTEIYEQVTNLLREILPNIMIDESKSFSLFINFSSSLKKSSTDPYDEAIKRFNKKGPLYKLFFTNKHDQKQSLSSHELDLLREIILMTLNSYYELEKYNDKLCFDIIAQIGGKKTRG